MFPHLPKRWSELTPQMLSSKLSPGNTWNDTVPAKIRKKWKWQKKIKSSVGFRWAQLCLKSRFKWNFHLVWTHGSWYITLISVCPEWEGGLCGQEDLNLFPVSQMCFPIGLQTNEFVSLCLSSQPAWSEYNTSSLCSSSAVSICDTILQGRKTTASPHVLVPYQVELELTLTMGGFESLLETILTAFQPPCFASLHYLIPCDALNMNVISRPCLIPAWIGHHSLPGTWFVTFGLRQQSNVHKSVCLCTHTLPPPLHFYQCSTEDHLALHSLSTNN